MSLLGAHGRRVGKTGACLSSNATLQSGHSDGNVNMARKLDIQTELDVIKFESLDDLVVETWAITKNVNLWSTEATVSVPHSD